MMLVIHSQVTLELNCDNVLYRFEPCELKFSLDSVRGGATFFRNEGIAQNGGVVFEMGGGS